MRSLLIASMLLLPAAMPGQQRDFLTADEADQIRLAQEPNVRLQLYAGFAKQRIDLIKQMVTAGKPGRTMMIHDALEDYTEIIDAIDTVTDDALKRKADLTEGLKAVAEAQKEMLAALKEIEEKQPKDMSRYEFALKQAIETTEDSLELSQQDLGTRTAGVEARDAREKQQREAMTTPTELAERQAQEKKQAQTEQKARKKAPTLRRKGEVVEQKKR
jgi:hypothetical protein